MLRMPLNKSYAYCYVLVQGQIRSVIGQAKLLIAQRFKQFIGLVDNCEFKLGEKETTFTDLQGFWDMIYFQVLNIVKYWVCHNQKQPTFELLLELSTSEILMVHWFYKGGRCRQEIWRFATAERGWMGEEISRSCQKSCKSKPIIHIKEEDYMYIIIHNFLVAL